MRVSGKAAAILCSALCICALPVTGYAEEKINSVSVRLETDGYDNWGNPEIQAESKSGHYSAGEVYPAFDYYGMNGGYDENSNVYVIELDADDGYYFNITKSEKIRINGLSAEFVKASRQNNGQNLYITVELDVEAFVGEIEGARWEADGHASWDEAYGAQSYTLYFADGKGRIKQAETAGTTYDFRPYLQKEGTYTYKVRPKSSTGNGNEWVDGGSISVTEEMAAQNQKLFKVEKNVTYVDGIKSPDREIIEYLNTGWQKEEDGKIWYRNTDGSYLQTMWLEDNGNWYFFGSDGYMLSNEYITYGNKDYYVTETGKMLVNAKAPDGRTAESDGVLKK